MIDDGLVYRHILGVTHLEITEFLVKKITSLNLVAEKDGQNFCMGKSWFFVAAKWSKRMQPKNNLEVSTFIL